MIRKVALIIGIIGLIYSGYTIGNAFVQIRQYIEIPEQIMYLVKTLIMFLSVPLIMIGKNVKKI